MNLMHLHEQQFICNCSDRCWQSATCITQL